MKPKSLLLAVAGCLSLSACAVSVSTDDGIAARSAEAAFNAESAAAQLAPDAARYSTQTFDWLDGPRQRSVPARLYLPVASREASARPVPLVVFSHGIGGSRDGYKYLGRYLAANGYACLHVQHVGSDRQLWFGNPLGLFGRLSDAARESEAIDRVRDLSFALDQLLAGDVGARVDRQRIIVAGHSYGANTSMLAAGAQVERDGRLLRLRDDRIKAAILMSAPPFYGSTDTGRILSGITIPTLHITATEDDITIPGYRSGLTDRLDVYQAIGNGQAAPKALAVFKGGSHSIFTDRMGTGGMELNPKVKAATRDLAV
ncbi:MAG: alpha/beta fold hydrolase, partial [Betaproteobacteria bacterium]